MLDTRMISFICCTGLSSLFCHFLSLSKGFKVTRYDCFNYFQIIEPLMMSGKNLA
jgi:hypothetical protein